MAVPQRLQASPSAGTELGVRKELIRDFFRIKPDQRNRCLGCCPALVDVAACSLPGQEQMHEGDRRGWNRGRPDDLSRGNTRCGSASFSTISETGAASNLNPWGCWAEVFRILPVSVVRWRLRLN